MPKELYPLDPIGVCAVKQTISSIQVLQARADDLQRQARRALEAAEHNREDLIRALSHELGVAFPSSSRFRLNGSTVEVMWQGAPEVVEAPEAPEAPEAEEEPEVEEAKAPELTAAAG